MCNFLYGGEPVSATSSTNPREIRLHVERDGPYDPKAAAAHSERFKNDVVTLLFSTVLACLTSANLRPRTLAAGQMNVRALAAPAHVLMPLEALRLLDIVLYVDVSQGSQEPGSDDWEGNLAGLLQYTPMMDHLTLRGVSARSSQSDVGLVLSPMAHQGALPRLSHFHIQDFQCDSTVLLMFILKHSSALRAVHLAHVDLVGAGTYENTLRRIAATLDLERFTGCASKQNGMQMRFKTLGHVGMQIRSAHCEESYCFEELVMVDVCPAVVLLDTCDDISRRLAEVADDLHAV